MGIVVFINLNDTVTGGGGGGGGGAWGTITGTLSAQTDLQAALNNKAALSHTHTKANITDFAHTHVRSDITDFAHTHLWADISDKPLTFTPSTHTHLWADITDKPLTFTPSTHTHTKANITDFAHTHLWADITDKPSTFTPSTHTHLWADITDKPVTFAPSAHSHAWGTITGTLSSQTDLQSALDAKAGTVHAHATTDITSGILGIARGGTGSATVPTNGQLLIGNGTGYTVANVTGGTGITVTNGVGTITIASTITPGSAVWGSITGTLSSQTDLNSALAGKANTSHTHLWADITDKPSTFTPAAHNHAATEITSGLLPIARGGTNIGTVPTNGQLLIGNGTGYAVANITAGSGIAVTNGVGTITIAATAASNNWVVFNTNNYYAPDSVPSFSTGNSGCYNIGSSNSMYFEDYQNVISLNGRFLEFSGSSFGLSNAFVFGGGSYRRLGGASVSNIAIIAPITDLTQNHSASNSNVGGPHTRLLGNLKATFIGNPWIDTGGSFPAGGTGTWQAFDIMDTITENIGSNFYFGRRHAFFSNDMTVGARIDLYSTRSDFANTSQLDGTNTSFRVRLSAPTSLASNVTFQLPSSNGSSGQFLTTNGSGVTSWANVSLSEVTLSQHTASPNNTVNATRILANAASANADLVLQPKGTGALLAQLPDGTATGGNKRGTQSVDLQLSRTLNTEVAQGNYCGIVGGQRNTASGNYTFIAAGLLNNTSGSSQLVTGSGNAGSGNYSLITGSGNVCNGAFGFVIGSNNNLSSGSYITTIGQNNTSVQGDYAFVVGSSNTTSSAGGSSNVSIFGNAITSNSGVTNVLALGSSGTIQANSKTKIMVATGALACGTDYQSLTTDLTGASWSSLSSNAITMVNGQVMHYEINVVGVRGTDLAAYKITGVAFASGGAITLYNNVSTVITEQGSATSWDARVSSSGLNLLIQGYGDVSGAVRWGATAIFTSSRQ